MNGMLTLEQLKEEFAAGSLDTVLACQIDMQGRLMGKRFHIDYFINHAVDETHSCNYLLATDLEMETVSGYKSTSWEAGYGDYVMKPDLTTLRRVPWLEGTALVLCDVLDHHYYPVAHSPRAILRKQIDRLDAMGIVPIMATELEFFMFDQSYADACVSGYKDMKPVSSYNEDYHIFQTTKEEGVIRAIRNGVYGAGIVVECSKGEASAGQEELNIKYDNALTTADHHSIAKHACKEIAWQNGKAITFMAKWDKDATGSASHVHQSLWSKEGKPLFLDETQPYGMSELMRHYLAGLLAYADDVTCLLAPYINSYKRFQEGTFAPTKAVWSLDNRTAGFRLCGAETKGIRIECRIGGSDLNPYLALAGQLAAGIAGIENKLPLEEAFVGDAYASENAHRVPNTLRVAIEKMNDSTMLRDAFGDEVVDHYVRAARWEQQVYDQQVTDWEVARGFERC
ncbi:glutamine synthetase family protein [Marinomonas sp. 2405UD68-3]|uniref:glutamine synthetase family protein n=1 Tax=Marinomonas sp. 2405UD68-3 TaxID=3391835 RepID=UPI0039C8E31F